jgi:hypothetical protein
MKCTERNCRCYDDEHGKHVVKCRKCLRKGYYENEICVRCELEEYAEQGDVNSVKMWMENNSEETLDNFTVELFDVYLCKMKGQVLKAFLIAIRKGHKDIVRYFMELDVFEDVDKGTAFDIIVEENKVEMMDFVLKNNLFMLDPKEIDNALIRSAQIDELDMVKCLVENGANIHAKNEYVLKESVSNANYKVVKYLLENGADVSVDDNIVLKMSIENGDDDIVELIRTVATK